MAPCCWASEATPRLFPLSRVINRGRVVARHPRLREEVLKPRDCEGCRSLRALVFRARSRPARRSTRAKSQAVRRFGRCPTHPPSSRAPRTHAAARGRRRTVRALRWLARRARHAVALCAPRAQSGARPRSGRGRAAAVSPRNERAHARWLSRFVAGLGSVRVCFCPQKEGRRKDKQRSVK